MSDDIIWQRNEIESPCVRICVVHPETRLCTGCARSLEEIGNWSRMSPEDRRSVIDALPDRKPFPTKRRSGRKARLERS